MTIVTTADVIGGHAIDINALGLLLIPHLRLHGSPTMGECNDPKRISRGILAHFPLEYPGNRCMHKIEIKDPVLEEGAGR
jgi:hypothetical protein